jgi:isopentenyl diphosphate isomerase/L-lactate dehydrogenase-like FMN-dependent dehydrogenase
MRRQGVRVELRWRPPWYQLYPSSRWEVTERLVRRVEQAGCPVIALTVDTQAGRRTETFERAKLLDKRDCKTCHGTRYEDFFRRKPMFSGIDIEGLRTANQALDWAHVRKLRKMTTLKLMKPPRTPSCAASTDWTESWSPTTAVAPKRADAKPSSASRRSWPPLVDYVWGLAAFGQPGVERVIDLLRTELELVMKQCGVTTVGQISRAHVGVR